MSWEWSHTDEAYEDAYQNLHNLDRETLCVIAMEWDTEIFHEGEYLDGWYDRALKIILGDKVLTSEILADGIWLQCAEDQEINGSWFGRTCDNGGFNAWVCPHGCHTVPFDRKDTEE